MRLEDKMRVVVDDLPASRGTKTRSQGLGA
jgi:hypothetical protein